MAPLHETNTVFSEVSERIENRIQSVHFYFLFFPFPLFCALAVGGRRRRWIKWAETEQFLFIMFILYILLLNVKCVEILHSTANQAAPFWTWRKMIGNYIFASNFHFFSLFVWLRGLVIYKPFFLFCFGREMEKDVYKILNFFWSRN